MGSVQSGELPPDALLNPYQQNGAYTDCFYVDLPGVVSQAAYVEAFYTTPVFKVERLILAAFALKPSTDLQAKMLAQAQTEHYAAWSVEGRTPNQLLLCDFLGRTRSWLMTVVDDRSASPVTRLYFGSAFVPAVGRASGRASFGIAFHALQGFHRVYSRVLLKSAMSRLLSLQHG